MPSTERSAPPNWAIWRYVVTLTVWEAIALTCNLQPVLGMYINSRIAKSVDEFARLGGGTYEPPQDEYHRRVRIALSYLGKKQLPPATVIAPDDPSNTIIFFADVIALAISLGCEIPDELKAGGTVEKLTGKNTIPSPTQTKKATTARNRQIHEMCAAGKKPKQIADALHIDVSTVRRILAVPRP